VLSATIQQFQDLERYSVGVDRYPSHDILWVDYIYVVQLPPLAVILGAGRPRSLLESEVCACV
jgi:hypothetical protein